MPCQQLYVCALFAFHLALSSFHRLTVLMDQKYVGFKISEIYLANKLFWPSFTQYRRPSTSVEMHPSSHQQFGTKAFEYALKIVPVCNQLIFDLAIIFRISLTKNNHFSSFLSLHLSFSQSLARIV